MTRSLTIFTVWLGLCGGAAAQDADVGNLSRYDFEETLVAGDRHNPDGEVLHVRPRGERNSLIRVREQFIAELLHSVERL